MKMTKEVDARGLSCPIPVVKTKQAMEKNPSDEITVWVDSRVAKENVSRLAKSKNYSVNIQVVSNDEYQLTLRPTQ
jgi:tRNA 2-thiouridine synthesizing protein A